MAMCHPPCLSLRGLCQCRATQGRTLLWRAPEMISPPPNRRVAWPCPGPLRARVPKNFSEYGSGANQKCHPTNRYFRTKKCEVCVYESGLGLTDSQNYYSGHGQRDDIVPHARGGYQTVGVGLPLCAAQLLLALADVDCAVMTHCPPSRAAGPGGG
ncbi:hypothetical protein J6590_070464 [Homalodisca vitripennis]|nr:hypothetical protein J6590_070464 [Homalodisca vitripennis]